MVRMIMELVRNRSFTLTTGDSKQSRLHCLKNGVPKGSVLAPFLVNIYTYNLPSMISRKFAYADDLALLHSSGNWKDLEEILSQDMSTFSAYLPGMGSRSRSPEPRSQPILEQPEPSFDVVWSWSWSQSHHNFCWLQLLTIYFFYI